MLTDTNNLKKIQIIAFQIIWKVITDIDILCIPNNTLSIIHLFHNQNLLFEPRDVKLDQLSVNIFQNIFFVFNNSNNCNNIWPYITLTAK